MSPSPSPKFVQQRATLLNVPNQVTLARLVLAIVLFGLMHAHLYFIGLIVFILAASTDWLDGYLARKWGMVTPLGRILDPFADKIIVCGTFVFLAAEPTARLPTWVVVLVIGRELLVTGLRSFLEQQGADFSATWSGKVKMVAQCFTAGLCLGLLAFGDQGAFTFLPLATDLAVYSTIALTVYSGVAYVLAALRLLRQL